MSTPRITQRLMVQRSLSSLNGGFNRLAQSQEQISTGRVINRPSDSPTGTNDAMRLRASIAANAQYTRNADDGVSWLNRTDSVLGSMLDSTRRARDLIVQGSSTGSAGPAAREALAQELTQIRQSLVDDANTSHLGRPIFGGNTAGAAAYDASGTFVGDSGEVSRTVGAGVSVPVNVTGPAAFSTGSDDLFTVLSDAITALRTDPDATSATLARLDSVSTVMSTARTDVGARTNRIESAREGLVSTALDTKSSLSDVENVDIAAATMDLQMQEVAYQASLAATARVIQPSLVDFLK